MTDKTKKADEIALIHWLKGRLYANAKVQLITDNKIVFVSGKKQYIINVQRMA